MVTLFNALYKPARRGRKIAYLTVANFAFLLFALAAALWGKHASAYPPGNKVSSLPNSDCVDLDTVDSGSWATVVCDLRPQKHATVHGPQAQNGPRC